MRVSAPALLALAPRRAAVGQPLRPSPPPANPAPTCSWSPSTRCGPTASGPTATRAAATPALDRPGPRRASSSRTRSCRSRRRGPRTCRSSRAASPTSTASATTSRPRSTPAPRPWPRSSRQPRLATGRLHRRLPRVARLGARPGLRPFRRPLRPRASATTRERARSARAASEVVDKALALAGRPRDAALLRLGPPLRPARPLRAARALPRALQGRSPYDGEVAYADAQLARLLEWLDRSGEAGADARGRDLGPRRGARRPRRGRAHVLPLRLDAARPPRAVLAGTPARGRARQRAVPQHRPAADRPRAPGRARSRDERRVPRRGPAAGRHDPGQRVLRREPSTASSTSAGRRCARCAARAGSTSTPRAPSSTASARTRARQEPPRRPRARSRPRCGEHLLALDTKPPPAAHGRRRPRRGRAARRPRLRGRRPLRGPPLGRRPQGQDRRVPEGAPGHGPGPGALLRRRLRGRRPGAAAARAPAKLPDGRSSSASPTTCPLPRAQPPRAAALRRGHGGAPGRRAREPALQPGLGPPRPGPGRSRPAAGSPGHPRTRPRPGAARTPTCSR